MPQVNSRVVDYGATLDLLIRLPKAQPKNSNLRDISHRPHYLCVLLPPEYICHHRACRPDHL